MQHRFERIAIQTPRHRIVGVATLASDGYRSRLSDLLNAPERDFIPLTDATVTELDGDHTVSQHEFIAVHRQHVVFAVPLGEVAEPAGGPVL
ncbi:MAG TPA: hypothetical protein VFZ89_14130 [Solirubrobacteraceae bacterium]